MPRSIALSAVIALTLLAAGATAAAPPKPIRGQLSKPGYTVIALAAGGRATSVRSKTRSFRLRPPSARVTLHLRGPDGTYAGPIVVAAERNRAILGARAGASLGKITIRGGYAKVGRKLQRKWVDRARWARARKGVPIGARVFGRVRSQLPRSSAPADRDVDGIPDVFDIDDDGDLTLDNLDRSMPARLSFAQSSANEFGLFSRLTLTLDTTANANAPGLTDAMIEWALPSLGDLLISILPGDSAELDCGHPDTGLPYCRKNGSTGRRIVSYVPENFPPFPGCCDADADGFGTLTPITGQAAMTLRHGASSTQIGTGDLLIQRVTTGGVESQFPATLPYVFATVPALVSFSDGAGNSTTVSYPVAGHGPNPGPPGPGTRENPFLVQASPGGDVVLTVTFWRPQRKPIPPETGNWIDIGGLDYTAGVADTGAFCPQSAFSEGDPNLTVPSSPIHRPDAGGFMDLAADQPANAVNTITYTLNVTQCFAAKGLPPWNPGEKRGLSFSGLPPNGPDEAQQAVFFKRP